MALVIADHVKETSTTTGAGALTLSVASEHRHSYSGYVMAQVPLNTSIFGSIPRQPEPMNSLSVLTRKRQLSVWTES